MMLLRNPSDVRLSDGWKSSDIDVNIAATISVMLDNTRLGLVMASLKENMYLEKNHGQKM